jgi:hypothetical protein
MSYNHLRRVRVGKSSFEEEVLVIAEDRSNGDIYYVRVNELDHVDRQRAIQVLGKRDANQYPLWDLLDQTTFKNGVNALEYFHQLTYVMNRQGDVTRPGKGTGSIYRNVQQPVAKAVVQQARQQQPAQVVNEGVETGDVDVVVAAQAVAARKAGRPKKT